MQIKRPPGSKDIFCSLLTRKDGMQELAEKYGLSAKELASMYERSVEEIMDDWDAMAQERQELQAIRVRSTGIAGRFCPKGTSTVLR